MEYRCPYCGEMHATEEEVEACEEIDLEEE